MKKAGLVLAFLFIALTSAPAWCVDREITSVINRYYDSLEKGNKGMFMSTLAPGVLKSIKANPHKPGPFTMMLMLLDISVKSGQKTTFTERTFTQKTMSPTLAVVNFKAKVTVQAKGKPVSINAADDTLYLTRYKGKWLISDVKVPEQR